MTFNFAGNAGTSSGHFISFPPAAVGVGSHCVCEASLIQVVLNSKPFRQTQQTRLKSNVRKKGYRPV